MRGIVGRIEFHRNAFGFTVASALARDHGIGQRLPNSIQHLRSRCVLKARQRRLRGQPCAFQRIAVNQHLVHRIIGEPRRIVTVDIAAGDGKYPLANQIVQRVFDLPRLALIGKTRGDALGQPQPLVARLEQHAAAVATAVRLIELRHHRLVEKLRKHDTLSCGTFSHAKASLLVHYALSQERMYQSVRPLYIQVRE